MAAGQEGGERNQFGAEDDRAAGLGADGKLWPTGSLATLSVGIDILREQKVTDAQAAALEAEPIDLRDVVRRVVSGR